MFAGLNVLSQFKAYIYAGLAVAFVVYSGALLGGGYWHGKDVQKAKDDRASLLQTIAAQNRILKVKADDAERAQRLLAEQRDQARDLESKIKLAWGRGQLAGYVEEWNKAPPGGACDWTDGERAELLRHLTRPGAAVGRPGSAARPGGVR